jgi:hypothetical protein
MTTTPTDRNALNRALQEALRTQGLVVPCPHGTVGREYCWQCGETGPDYCGSLDAADGALTTLGLEWGKFKRGVSVWREGHDDTAYGTAEDNTPGAFATALVQAAVQVLTSDGTS